VMPELGEIGEEVPSLKGRTYLDSAATGLPPRSVTERMTEMIQDWSKNGEDSARWLEEVESFRREAGALVGVRQDELAVVQNASSGLAALASSVDYSRRRKVVTCASNFPSNVLVWQRLKEMGALDQVSVLQQKDGAMALEEWQREVDDRTAVVAVDYVSWISGFRENVRELARVAHDAGALVFVDAYHAVGVFPVDLAQDRVDGGCFGFAKWLCGPHGVSCLYVSKDLLETSSPAQMGWMGAKDNVLGRMREGRDVFDKPFSVSTGEPAPGASRFELGTYPHVLIAGARGALEFARRYTPAQRFEVIKKRREALREVLEREDARILTPDHDSNPGSGILTILEVDHKKLVDDLVKRRVVVSGRFGHVRVSPHFYNSEEDVERFAEAYRAAKLR